jgi:uncharacterized protein
MSRARNLARDAQRAPETSADFLDVNVWLALADPQHTHHAAASAFWADATSHARPLVFCRVTMLGFLRLLTQPAVMGAAVHTPSEAWAVFAGHMANGFTVFQEEASRSLLDQQLGDFALQPGFHARDWTDAYLAAFAISRGLRLVSFDKGFQRFAPLQFLLLTA